MDYYIIDIFAGEKKGGGGGDRKIKCRYYIGPRLERERWAEGINTKSD
jgi:hypothetical protein